MKNPAYKTGFSLILTTNNHKTNSSCHSNPNDEKHQICRSRYGNRTRVSSVKGMRPNP
jgi:hypothetical protein